MSAASDVLLRLPTHLRDELKDPLGEVHADVTALLDGLDGPIVAVGDVVSYHCELSGRSADVAIVDGRTKRSAVDPDVERTLAASDAVRMAAVNPPGTLTRSLLEALVKALERPESVMIEVEGEEDLAALPAVRAAPVGAHVLYGQPGEGMVHVPVDAEHRDRVRSLLERMDGATDEVHSLLAT